jgi:cysteine/O-acetylserine efflux protein
MEIAVAPTVAFVLATTFSPGPNNILSGTIGMMRGYRRALPFTLGVATGFVLMMSFCAAAATALRSALPDVTPILRYVGAGYVVWLAWTVWRDRGRFGSEEGLPKAQGFPGGFLLQFVNPKLAAYGLTLFTTLLAPLTDRACLVAISTVALAVVSLASTTTWALTGAAIRRRLCTDRARSIAAGVLVLALVYTAVELVRP